MSSFTYNQARPLQSLEGVEPCQFMSMMSEESHPNSIDYEIGGHDLFLKKSCLDNVSITKKATKRSSTSYKPRKTILLEGGCIGAILLASSYWWIYHFKTKSICLTFENKIDALAKEVEEFKITQSIPEICKKITATIIPQIGEIDRFNRVKN